MQITVFGASGKVGRLVVEEALSRGHSVVAFVHRSKLPATNNLTVIQGNVYKLSDVTKAVQGSGAVISALGSWGTKRKDVTEQGMANIIPAMEAVGIKRVISVTGHGASAPGDKFEPVHEFSRLLLKLLAAKILRDGEKHIQRLHGSSLEWTVIRSPVMNNRVGGYKISLSRPWPLATVGRHSVADCLVDLAENREYMRKAPYIVRDV
jgi:putative NADH-flavin reductase